MRVRESPTITTLGVFAIVFLAQQIVALSVGWQGALGLFALSTPVGHEPWTVLTSVYAHTNLSHLGVNALALVVVGVLLERETTAVRYHAFFVTTGALSGLAEVWLAATLGSLVGGIAANVAVLGGSGAIFALAGYLLTSNRLTDRVAAVVPVAPRVQYGALVLLAVVVTLATGRPGVALVAHFTGLLLGLLAGRGHLLRPSSDSGPQTT